MSVLMRLLMVSRWSLQRLRSGRLIFISVVLHAMLLASCGRPGGEEMQRRVDWSIVALSELTRSAERAATRDRQAGAPDAERFVLWALLSDPMFGPHTMSRCEPSEVLFAEPRGSRPDLDWSSYAADRLAALEQDEVLQLTGFWGPIDGDEALAALSRNDPEFAVFGHSPFRGCAVIAFANGVARLYGTDSPEYAAANVERTLRVREESSTRLRNER